MPQIINMEIKKNVATSFYVALPTQANVHGYQANPTLAAGDVKHTGDGSALANLGTIPAVEPAGSRVVKVTLAQTETNYTNIAIIFADAAGAEWDEVIIVIRTFATTTDDLVRSTTPANALTVDSSGNVTPADGSITAAKLGADCITAAKIATGAIDADAIADNAIDAGAIAAGAITAAKIDTAAITSAKFAASAIDASAIAADAIAASKIAAGAITADKIASDAISAPKIAAAAFTAAKFDTGAITASAIAASAIASDKFAPGAITAAAIGSDAITAAKLAADCITAAKIATGAIDSDALAATGLAAISGGVWDLATSSHAIAGSFGAQVKTVLDSILDDTGTAGVKVDLINSTIDESNTGLNMNGALNVTRAEAANLVADLGVGSTRTSYRVNGTTPLITRTRTATSFAP